MSVQTSIIDGSTQPEVNDPLEALYVKLADLLCLHYETWLDQWVINHSFEPELGSIHLTSLQFVSGEKSGVRSCMRFDLKIGHGDAEAPKDVETFTVELSVKRKNQKC